MSAVDLSQRTFLVTGASRGIGLAIALHLRDAGADIVGVSRQPPANEWCSIMTHEPADLADINELPRRLRTIAAAHRDIDGIVLNAGIGRFGAIEQFSADQIRQLLELNLVSPLLVAREFVPRLKRRGYGDVVIIGSESALKGGRRGAVYSASKFGLRGFAQSLREECANAGVRVGIVNPGMVDTGFFDTLDFRPGREAGQHLVADDVARAVVHMVGSRSGSIVDEINLSPASKVIDFGGRES